MKNKLNELKKLVKSKCFFHALVLIILIIVAIFLYQMGFRITYAPDLETSWDAVSAVASWAGAIGTVAAVFSAVYVANQQNRIALFEKRYRIYNELCNCKTFSCALSLTNSIEDVKLLFLSTFEGKSLMDELLRNIDEKNYIHCYTMIRSRELLVTFKESKFLFTQDSCFFQYIENVTEKLMLLLAPIAINDVDFIRLKSEFIMIISSETYDEVLHKMEKELKLNSLK